MRSYMFTLLVVLALSACLLAAPAGAVMRVASTGEPTAVTDVIGAKDGGGNIGGDDDRWGDSLPSILEPDPEAVPGGGGDEGDVVVTGKLVIEESVMAKRLRFFLSTAVLLLYVR